MNTQFEKAIALMDAANAKDPAIELYENKNWPKELLYALRLYVWVKKLEPNASETLLLASRCQHICRWQKPRSEFEQGRTGYLQWRTQLGLFHAEKSGEILKSVGYDSATIANVQQLNRKTRLKHGNHEAQVLEDALCLIFLEHQLEAFVKKYNHDEVKLINIIRKTWQKMSENGRNEALKLSYSSSLLTLIQKAVI